MWKGQTNIPFHSYFPLSPRSVCQPPVELHGLASTWKARQVTVGHKYLNPITWWKRWFSLSSFIIILHTLSNDSAVRHMFTTGLELLWSWSGDYMGEWYWKCGSSAHSFSYPLVPSSGCPWLWKWTCTGSSISCAWKESAWRLENDTSNGCNGLCLWTRHCNAIKVWRNMAGLRHPYKSIRLMAVTIKTGG